MFELLKQANDDAWHAYIQHDFVRGLADGSLPKACFQHYLKQDYLFLIHFARAYGLAVYKSTSLEDMRHAQASLSAILDTELDLHISYCRDWGIDPATLRDLPESRATMAYTRYVLERGLAGDLVDLHVALSPCVIGYAEVAEWILAQPETKLDGNPYRSWIVMYSSEEYREVAASARTYLDTLGEGLSPQALARHQKSFGEATRLEADFWQMGLDLAD